MAPYFTAKNAMPSTVTNVTMCFIDILAKNTTNVLLLLMPRLPIKTRKERRERRATDADVELVLQRELLANLALEIVVLVLANEEAVSLVDVRTVIIHTIRRDRKIHKLWDRWLDMIRLRRLLRIVRLIVLVL